jgi:DMSO/TMAO reductase YedYZ heme-binding membrane subunit
MTLLSHALDWPLRLQPPPSLVALLILSLLAATSHGFWLGFLMPPVWKALHMTIHAAYDPGRP